MRVSLAVAAAFLLGYSWLSQASDEATFATGAASALHDVPGEPDRDEARESAYSPAMRDRLGIVLDDLRLAVGSAQGPAVAAARARITNTMSPIAASRSSVRKFTELRFRSTDVLMSGDSLTLRAGSDRRVFISLPCRSQGQRTWPWPGAGALGGATVNLR